MKENIPDVPYETFLNAASECRFQWSREAAKRVLQGRVPRLEQGWGLVQEDLPQASKAAPAGEKRWML